MTKLKSEKYKGWSVKFEKGRFFDIDGVRAILSKGKLSGVQMGGSKEEAFKNAKAIIDQEEGVKNKAIFSGSGNKHIGWIFHISKNGERSVYKTFSTIPEAKAYFKKNNYSVDWRGLK